MYREHQAVRCRNLGDDVLFLGLLAPATVISTLPSSVNCRRRTFLSAMSSSRVR
jgi:hypothetical protein